MVSRQKVESLVKELSALLRNSEVPLQVETVTKLIASLDALAVALRTAELRPILSASDLPNILQQCLNQVKAGLSGQDTDVWWDLAFQSGRVAANLAADCDDGRAALSSAGYPSAAIKLLIHQQPSQAYLNSANSLIISLLNLTIERHEAAVAAIGNWDNLSQLMQFATRITSPDLPSSSHNWELSKLVWTVIDAVTEPNVKQLAPESSTGRLRPFGIVTNCFLPENKAFLPQKSTPLFVLTLAASVLDSLSATELVPVSASFGLIDEGGNLIDHLVEFAERAFPPTIGTSKDIDEEDEEEEIDVEKSFAAAKAAVIRAIVNLSIDVELDNVRGERLWIRMRTWLDNPRDDLRSCALLIFGNVARRDATAKRLAEGPDSLLSSVIPLLSPSTPVTVQHGLVGLLRNLSVLPDNRAQLFEAGILEKLLSMGVWTQERDLVGSVQGGAIVIFKHLCRDSGDIASSFARNTQAIEQLLSLIGRTDQQPMKWEGTRVFVNTIRSLSRDASKYSEALAPLADRRILRLLCDMIVTGSKHAVLINEAVIGLALLATMGPMGTHIGIASVLEDRTGMGSDQEPISARDILSGIVAKEASSVQVADEIRANVELLLNRLPVVPPRVEEIE